MPKPKLYSQRLLNPFSGVIQVLENDDARATSTDGINWRIQIQSEIYRTPWRELEVPTSYDGYLMYGIWSKTGELARIPIHPTLYQEHVEQSAQNLIGELIKYHHHIPFPATDIYECWLFDAKLHLPIALINSATSDELPPFPSSPIWYPCDHNDNRFKTSAFRERNLNGSNPLGAKEVLGCVFNNHAGLPATAIWIKRTESSDGQVIATNNKHKLLQGEQITMAAFPELGFKSTWDDKDEQQITNDYIQWLSPVLLTLPQLRNETRAQLERYAQLRPLEVEKYHRLYSEVHDAVLLKKILVEATMRKAANQVE